MITFLDWVGRVTSVIFIVTLALGGYAWLKGIIPALWRLGNGFSKRKIAIFAKGDTLVSLNNLLLDTKMFNKKNIVDISTVSDFGRAERTTLILVSWDDWQQDRIDEILRTKKDNTALVIYAPKGPRSIPEAKFVELNNKRNVMVTNFRGRLLNDIVVSLMTTSYQ